MTTPQTTANDSTSLQGANGAFPADVVAFAVANQVQHCLQPLLEATHRIFPNACFIKVAVEEDPELRDNTQIVFRVQVDGYSVDESQAARRKWHEAMLSLYRPLRKLLFCLYLTHKS
jgi:hypothetical protein